MQLSTLFSNLALESQGQPPSLSLDQWPFDLQVFLENLVEDLNQISQVWIRTPCI
jgi:hypothetical protein